ncbi:MAG: hypothetical protein HQ446_05855 [Polaromonas sp.]|nr:hypothetical protein [Polaromonas sp.]
MATQYSVATRTAQMSQLNTIIGINAQIRLFSGVAPATVDTATSGTLLVSFAGNATAFGAAASGVLTASAVAGVNAAAAGTAGYYRINTTAGVAVTQGTITATGGGGDMTLTNTNIAAGQACTFTSLTITAFGA